MSQKARHFDLVEWADYVRNASTAELQREMKTHLDSGCSKCKELEAMLTKFARIASGELQRQVPDTLEHTVRAFFAAHAQSRSSVLQRILGSLVYDSGSDPLPAGVRGGHQISRQMLFHAGEYSLDLRLEHEKGSANMVLVGQIANRNTPENALTEVPVILYSGDKELVRSVSNSFGEFHFEYEPRPNLRLQVPVESRGELLDIPLGNTWQAA